MEIGLQPRDQMDERRVEEEEVEVEEGFGRRLLLSRAKVARWPHGQLRNNNPRPLARVVISRLDNKLPAVQIDESVQPL